MQNNIENKIEKFKTTVLSPTAENISLAANVIQRLDLVGMPTETVYGLAGHAFAEEALNKIFKMKERPFYDPLIIHVYWEMKNSRKKPWDILVEMGVIDGPASMMSSKAIDKVNLLMEHFWPGPLTLVLPKGPRIPLLATGGLPTVALRMPQHPVAQQLISKAGVPLAAPSANLFGRISPTSAMDVFNELYERLDVILDGGPCEVGVESTILSLQSPSLQAYILRPGGASLEEIEKILGHEVLKITKFPKNKTENTENKEILAPGMLDSHYAPRKKLFLLPKPFHQMENEEKIAFFRPLLAQYNCDCLGLLLLSGNPIQASRLMREVLGVTVLTQSLDTGGDFTVAARNLFSMMRSLDESPAQIIVSDLCQETHGSALAIQDRLQRAATKLDGDNERKP